MLISHFSKDGKRGFAVGSNSLTPEKIAAGLITAASGLVIAGIGGLFKPKKPSRAGAAKEKKKPPIWLAALPIVYKKAKTGIKKQSYDRLINGIIDMRDSEQNSDIEVISATPVASEEEAMAIAEGELEIR